MMKIKIRHTNGRRIMRHHDQANIPAWLAHYNGARGSHVEGYNHLGAVVSAEVIEEKVAA
jgi:hypothetical protein